MTERKRHDSILANMDIFYDESVRKSGISCIERQMMKDAVYCRGNRSRIVSVLKKAGRGEDLTVCCFGGSITEGALSTKVPDTGVVTGFEEENNCYCDWICEWFQRVFGINVNKINAGIGATDTVFATHRMGEDVLAHEPDLVIVEWAVNDGAPFLYKQGTYESMIRKFLKSGVALLALEMCTKDGTSSQSLHENIADFYDIPMISYKNAYVGHDFFEHFYITQDGVHPNMIGHPMTALLVTSFLRDVYADMDSSEKNDYMLPENTVNQEAAYYENAYVAKFRDIYDGKVEGVRVKELGSFYFEDQKVSFGYRSYYGLRADYAEKYRPLVIEIDSCKTAFLLVYRNTILNGSNFYVELNGIEQKSNSFTCKHGSDNEQTEWAYHWATERLTYNDPPQKTVIKISPAIDKESPDSYIRLLALLLS